MNIFNRKLFNILVSSISLQLFSTLIFTEISAKADELKVNIQTGHLEKINDLKFNKGNTFFASSSDDKTVKIYSISTGKEILTISENIKSVKNVYFVKSLVIFVTSDNKIKIVDIYSNKLIKVLNSSSEVINIKDNLLVYQNGNNIFIYDINSNKVIKTISEKNNLSALSFSSDGKFIITGDHKGNIALIDYKSSKLIKRSNLSKSVINSLIASDKYIVFYDKTNLNSLDIKTLKPLYKSNIPIKDINLKDNNSFSVLQDNKVKIFNIKDFKNTNTFVLSHKGTNINIFDINNNYIVYNDKESIILLDLLTKNIKYTIKNNTENLNAFSVIGKYLAYSTDNNIKILDMSNNTVRVLNKGHLSNITSIEFNPDSELLATGDNSGNVKLWNLPTQTILVDKNSHSGYISDFAFNIESIYFTSGSSDGDLKIWRVGSGQELVTLKGHTSKVNFINYHPDNERIITSSDDNTLKLWDSIDAKFLRNLRFSSKVNTAVFNPKGDLLAVGTGDDSKSHDKFYGLSIWNTEKLDKLYDLKGHEARITYLNFNREGDVLASGSGDNTIRLWNIINQKNDLTLRGHTDAIKYISFFAPSKNKILSISKDNTVRIWDLLTGKEMAKIVFLKSDKYIIINSQNNICPSENLSSEELKEYISFYDNNIELDFTLNYTKYNNCNNVLNSIGY